MKRFLAIKGKICAVKCFSVHFLLTSIVMFGVVNIFTACYWAPGMHLGERASTDGSIDTLATFEGAEVHLQSISPASLVEAAKEERAETDVPAHLLEYKPEAYKLGKFDIVQVTVWEHQELSLPLGPYRNDNAVGQMVDENGEMFYPYAGQMQVEGKTVTELREMIVQSLSSVLNKPQLDVRLLRSQSQKAYVQGGVLKSGVIPLSNVPTTLLEAINLCGGIDSEKGDPTQIELVRDGKSYMLNMLAAYPAGQGISDIVLKNGDVVRVGSTNDSKVYVLGEVNRQQALSIKNGRMSLSQALAEVGGLQMLSAQSRGIYVIRGGMDKINVYHLNARNPMALVFGEQFELRPHDVVFVDATGLARWNRLVSQILPTAQTIYYSALSVHNVKVAKDDIQNW